MEAKENLELEFLNSVKLLPIPSKDILKWIRSHGSLSGSRFLGLAHADSDYDYLISPKDYEKMPDISHCSCDHFDSEGYGGGGRIVKYLRAENGKVINLLIFEDQESFDRWKKCFEILNLMKTTFPEIKESIKNKENRILLFNALREVLKPKEKKEKEGEKLCIF